MMTVRVCHVCSCHRDDDARVFERECVSLADAGYEVHLLANSSRSEPFLRSGVHIHPVPVFRTRTERIRARNRVAESAARLKPDLYHVHEPELLGATLKRAGNRPVIWDVHETYLNEIKVKDWLPKMLRPLVKFAWDRREKSLIKECAAVIPVSKWLAERYYPLHSRVVVLNNFPLMPKLNPAPAKRTPGTLVFTGTIAPNRGVLDVIRAMAILKQKSINVTFELAGTPVSGDYLNSLLQEAGQLGVAEQIHFHGHLSLENARKLQKKSAIGMVPHLESEGNLFGYPVKLLEFMMNGLPLVYSDIPVFRAVAGAFDAGIAVEPSRPDRIARAVETLLSDPGMAEAKGTNGMHAVYQHFNWTSESPKLLTLYRELTAG
jgi:glycosyltransferase involved in cell wall biosynthesis